MNWFAIAVVIAWLIGRLLTDRYYWSQWLWWIPTPAVLPVVLIGILASLQPRKTAQVKRRSARRWGACGAIIAMYFGVFEHRLLHRAPQLPNDLNAVKIMHWTAQPAVSAHLQPSADFIAHIDADVTILTDPGGLLQFEGAQEWLRDRHVFVTWPLAIVSRFPILSVRPVIAVDHMRVSLVEIDTAEVFGRSLSLHLIDMPSEPKGARMAAARRVRRMLDDLKAPPADLALGDFNIPRGSASLAAMFPHIRHAYDEAGHGYGATYYRRWPLYHIDHILLAESVSARRYDIIDPGIGRHRAQVVWLTALH